MYRQQSCSFLRKYFGMIIGNRLRVVPEDDVNQVDAHKINESGLADYVVAVNDLARIIEQRSAYRRD